MTYKALHPSNLERQNVKLALKVISPFVGEALRTLGAELNLLYATETAASIDLIHKWWRVVNVKTPSKGRRLNDTMQEPVRGMADMRIEFLSDFVEWLDTWKNVEMDTGRLTSETHSALRLTSYSLIEVSRYCLEELHFEYVLLGKFQTDSLEDRFGRYRRLSGSNYHVSVQQIFESEAKLRLQDSLVFPDMQELCKPCRTTFDAAKLVEDHGVKITADDIKKKEPNMPAITYIAGFCAHAALKKLPCEACALNLTTEERELQLDRNILIENLSRGALKFPQPVVVNAVLQTQLVLEKLSEKENATWFHAAGNQRELLLSLSKHFLSDNEDLDVCLNGHHPDTVLHNVLHAAANTLLKNYVNMRTDKLRAKKGGGATKKIKNAEVMQLEGIEKKQ